MAKTIDTRTLSEGDRLYDSHGRSCTYFQREAPPEAATEAGVKYDQAKPRPSLLPSGPLLAIAEVLTFGAKKYADDNWMKVPGAEGPHGRYADALFRHLLAWLGGEKLDPESGLSHLAHAGCCILFLIWFEQRSEK